MISPLSVFVVFISSLAIGHAYYNPIPIGSLVISTKQQIIVLQPLEYNGKDTKTTIFTASSNMIIVNTIYDPTARALFILLLNGTQGSLYLCQLVAQGELSSTMYQLPLSMSTSDINNLTTFTADVANKRVFLTDYSGTVTLFSMSGLMKYTVPRPASISGTIRSMAYYGPSNRLLVITDGTFDSCTNLNGNTTECCQAPPSASRLRTITVDTKSTGSPIYVMDGLAGIHTLTLGANGCPSVLRSVNKLGDNANLQLAVDGNLFFCSGSMAGSADNSLLLISNGTKDPRTIPMGSPIVALHLSYPSTKSSVPTEETCFNGITYSMYRVAVVLAALFGTIMGIFMCFNALFCVDFFMTKRIIHNLKQQIPHNLLEDRWNKLVEEKYAKLALEKQRKKDDPLPAPRRKSSAAAKNTSTSATPATTMTSAADAGHSETLQVPNPIPKIADYIRRKSEGYMSRRRSDDYRSQQSRGDETGTRQGPQRTQLGVPQVPIEPLQEENETRGSNGLRANLSRRELLKNDADFL